MQLRNPEALSAFVGKGPGRVMQPAELARKIGKSRGTIDHLLHGRMERCRPEVARAIERALGVPPGVIFVPLITIEQAARHNVSEALAS